MYIDYTSLNRACSKDSYTLLNINKLVDNSVGYKLLSFMDTYSIYNQILMFELDRMKTIFMTKQENYPYNIMPKTLNFISLSNIDLSISEHISSISLSNIDPIK